MKTVCKRVLLTIICCLIAILAGCAHSQIVKTETREKTSLTAQEHYVNGCQLLRQNKIDEALKEIKLAISLQPDLVDAHREYLNVMASLHQTQTLLKEYKDFLTTHPNQALAHYLYGGALTYNDNYEEAYKEFDKAIQIDPKFYGAYDGKAVYYEKTKNYDKAIEYLKKSLEINPEYADGYARLGSLYDLKGDSEQAIKNYEKALNLDPSESMIYNNMSGLYKDLERFDEAIRIATQLLEIDKRPLYQFMGFLNRAAVYIDKGEKDNARRDLISAIPLAKQEKSSEFLLSIGVLWAHHLHDYVQALNVLNEAINYNPSPQVAGQIKMLLNEINRDRKTLREKSIASTLQSAIEQQEEKILDTIKNTSDKEISIAEIALTLARPVYPEIDIKQYFSKLDRMAEELKTLIGNETDPEKVITTINHYLFDVKKVKVAESYDTTIEGNKVTVFISLDASDYSLLNEILDYMNGNCLGFSLLYLSLTERLNLPVFAVLLPQHIFVRYDDGKYRRNIESTNQGKNFSDEEYRTGKYAEDIKVWPENEANYLKNLSKKEVIATILFNRGTLWKGNNEKEVADYNKALELNPKSSECYYNRGICYYDMNDLEKALADYNKALELNPKFSECYDNRGRCYYDIGDLINALADFNNALKLNPKFNECYNRRGACYLKMSKLEKAMADFNECIRLNPEYADAYTNRGSTYNEKGDLKNALADYNKAIELNPNYSGTYRNRSLLYTKQEEFTKAAADMERCLELKPDAPDADKLKNRIEVLRRLAREAEERKKKQEEVK